MYVTLMRHVGVLYTDIARSTHRFVPQQRWFELENEGLILYDISIAGHNIGYVKKNHVVGSHDA